MPARDIYHNMVKHALIKAGWRITHDPLRLQWGTRDMYVDLGAEALIAAEQQDQKIAVEIKSFIGPSEIEDLRNALGQFVLYRTILETTEPERTLYLAVREATFFAIFDEPVGKLLIEQQDLHLIVFRPDHEEVIQWIP
ncbi:element excision factor XisH family protein [Candidatus Viridilinea mediisalina]|uniref:Fatty-acid synthase n=1 Tax=Candidatus Viridilinea mediisalina TaxID=2024553 RepID=A0A2A6RER1_9CHLR|nr:element excision factor XisH family protein [Candidatus Viridilinea mediisalina]PDW01183.1 fatty-acid synthase [Candidatus Viridilinea mediisalina]